jgi:hypothetical protein
VVAVTTAPTDFPATAPFPAPAVEALLPQPASAAIAIKIMLFRIAVLIATPFLSWLPEYYSADAAQNLISHYPILKKLLGLRRVKGSKVL